jgi:hypothetical protein
VCASTGYVGYRLGNLDGAQLMANNVNKDQRIAQLQAQLAAAGRAPGPAPGGAGPGQSAPTASSASEGVAKSVSRACPVNDTWDCARQLARGQKESDEFKANDEERYFYFEAREPGAFTVVVNPTLRSQALEFAIYDPDRKEVTRGAFDRGRPGSIEMRARTAGRYYIRLKLFICCVREPDSYTIALAS